MKKPTSEQIETIRLLSVSIANDCSDMGVKEGLLPLLEEQEIIVASVVFAHLLCLHGFTAKDLDGLE